MVRLAFFGECKIMKQRIKLTFASGTANSDGSMVAKSLQLGQDVQPAGK